MSKNNILIIIVAIFFSIIGLFVGFIGTSFSFGFSQPKSNVLSENLNNSKSLIALSSVSCNPSGNASVYSAGKLNGLNNIWSGIKGKFVNPGDGITCAAVINNNSDYIVYINDVIISSDGITCLGDENNISIACSSLKMNVIAEGIKTSTATTVGSTTVNAIDVSNNYISKNNGTASIIFDIKYEGNESFDNGFIASMPDVLFNIELKD